MDIVELDELRFAYLTRLNELADGNRRAGFDMWAIGREFDLDRKATVRIFKYLKNAGLAEPRAAGGVIGITHDGPAIVRVRPGRYLGKMVASAARDWTAKSGI